MSELNYMKTNKSESLFNLDEINGSNVRLNLNELEITVGNQENMDVRGFNLGAMTATSRGSLELGIQLKQHEYEFHVKFCGANFKDAGQPKADLKRAR